MHDRVVARLKAKPGPVLSVGSGNGAEQTMNAEGRRKISKETRMYLLLASTKMRRSWCGFC
jgi:hypothetical protein